MYFDSLCTTFVPCHSFNVVNKTSLNYYNYLSKDVALNSRVFSDPLRITKCSSLIAIFCKVIVNITSKFFSGIRHFTQFEALNHVIYERDLAHNRLIMTYKILRPYVKIMSRDKYLIYN